mmetsp:Transcript_16250/g.29219  ORF Transcript_16250/g.29219 Transcript_16250/m.29219 type:complete len:271 (+) Transcript_16250:35-847(+)
MSNLELAVLVFFCPNKPKQANPPGIYIFDALRRRTETGTGNIRIRRSASDSLLRNRNPSPSSAFIRSSGFIRFVSAGAAVRYLASVFPKVSLGNPSQERTLNSVMLVKLALRKDFGPGAMATTSSINFRAEPKENALQLQVEALNTKLEQLKEEMKVLREQLGNERVMKKALRRYVCRLEEQIKDSSEAAQTSKVIDSLEVKSEWLGRRNSTEEISEDLLGKESSEPTTGTAKDDNAEQTAVLRITPDAEGGDDDDKMSTRPPAKLLALD